MIELDYKSSPLIYWRTFFSRSQIRLLHHQTPVDSNLHLEHLVLSLMTPLSWLLIKIDPTKFYIMSSHYSMITIIFGMYFDILSEHVKANEGVDKTASTTQW